MQAAKAKPTTKTRNTALAWAVKSIPLGQVGSVKRIHSGELAKGVILRKTEIPTKTAATIKHGRIAKPLTSSPP